MPPSWATAETRVVNFMHEHTAATRTGTANEFLTGGRRDEVHLCVLIEAPKSDQGALGRDVLGTMGSALRVSDKVGARFGSWQTRLTSKAAFGGNRFLKPCGALSARRRP